jgi:hypothetical protein
VQISHLTLSVGAVEMNVEYSVSIKIHIGAKALAAFALPDGGSAARS